ncbi:NADPH:quinone oxidoreductase family protein [Amycolatopsis thermoflava]|uniref:NADPH:quinone reductase-like Zn-dependent oxidoreductase n=1 Tax=Amycolatopsis thermoflava TaxID=84480 RepID=A0A3N2H6E0_9PSEU|nr:NADPH:quinone oxidoreductase family protein [Amycolatopsis thermoflava]ROS44484.1 NADPH:quinone reductase-like Zn-dependent oxidoreductase [Amycolatopsis thermoflava]
MRALQLIELTGPSGLRLVEADEPSADGVVVDLVAAGVSFPDLLQTQGFYQVKRPLPFVPGAEAAGVVRSAPPESGLRAGQRVAVLSFEGTWQQVVAVAPERVLPLPDTVSPAAAAGLPVNYLTGHFALRRRAKAEAGETVLVHGAAGGVGVAALHLCRAWDLRSVAVVSDARKAEVAAAAGADHVLLVDGWLDEARRWTGGRGVDIVLDPVGGDRFTDSLRSLAPEGRLVVLGFTGGSIPTVKVNRLLLNNTSVLGAGWGEMLRQEPASLRRQWDELYPLLEHGTLTAAEPTVYPMAEAADALGALADRTATGKLVLDLR